MKFIRPITLTESMLKSSTVSEPAATEAAWQSGGAYAAGDLRIRASTHRVYLCTSSHSGSAIPPELDVARWTDAGPTLRWAPFDFYISTAAMSTTSLTYVLQPGYFNAFALYGLTGTQLSVVIKDESGGSIIYSHVAPLYEDPAGWYEYLFVAPRAITQVSKTNLPIRPDAEVSITVSAASGQPVGIGMITLGDMVDLLGDLAEFGGTEYGATAEPTTYSYIKTDDFGNTTIVRRHRATGMNASVALPRINADEALRQIQTVLDVPVAWVATDAAGYAGLNVFGLGSARMSYDSPEIAKLQITVKGMI